MFGTRIMADATKDRVVYEKYLNRVSMGSSLEGGRWMDLGDGAGASVSRSHLTASTWDHLSHHVYRLSV